jgi:glucose-fructose oxidoreductase
MGHKHGKTKVRFAVVGLGHIAQVAVLPAFAHAKRAEVTALVSSDPEKLAKLGQRHGAAHHFGYAEYDAALRSGLFDAVFIALPNDMHREYAVRAAEAGVHVLCEKPLAVSEAECRDMIRACDENDVRLMTAYRLHFEACNMTAVEMVNSGRIGRPRLFTSTFTMPVRAGDIRVSAARGGGVLFDMGVYCINAARYLFRDEPVEVSATMATPPDDPRFAAVEESVSVSLRFPGERLATFTVSFGTESVAFYHVLGTEGALRVDPAYGYTGELKLRLFQGGEVEARVFEKGDQFAPELDHFAECVLKGRDPEPDGEEGLVDVMVVEAAYRSARERRPIHLGDFPERVRRPGPELVRHYPPVKAPRPVNERGPARD